MIYSNSDILEKDNSVIGSIKDLKTYFRYKIASLCMTGDECDYESFSFDVNETIGLLDNLYEDTFNDILSDNDIIEVTRMNGGNFVYKKYID